MHKKTHVTIVGAGISGLYLAYCLQQRQVPFTLLEMRTRTGGRIYSPGGYDFGPAWFWRGHNRVIALLNELDIDYYLQQDDGFGLYQAPDRIQRLPQGYTGEAFRIAGGWQSVTDALARQIDSNSVYLGCTVREIHKDAEQFTLHIEQSEQAMFASHVALAIPPRLIAQNVAFSPPLSDAYIDELASTPTWMGSHAKAMIRYDKPFWREKGFSGTALSATGPLMQIHDASLPESSEAALFGFIGLSADERNTLAEQLEVAIVEQLSSLFGDHARRVKAVEIVDWSNETATSAVSDREPLNHHPVYGLSQTEFFDGRLHFCATETADHYGGFVEGALQASLRAFQRIIQDTE
ncbi:flavin monoamine oxidase family protein [Aestuariibacter salexigens]|uniref:flavin monoamine oxidase family protein n=1 Tax=Aestuariibacter salexigens TaxID=226010 RepID=UPI000408B781|nr:NAD(P)/FAD-dependent oxidoreductase [Aestuariibacter salexigens]